MLQDVFYVVKGKSECVYVSGMLLFLILKDETIIAEAGATPEIIFRSAHAPSAKLHAHA